jgi:hypothetical protein
MTYYFHQVGQKKRRETYDLLKEMGYAFYRDYNPKYCGFSITTNKKADQHYHKYTMNQEFLSEREFFSAAKLAAL